MSCIFCQIASGELASDFIYEDDQVMVFHDIHPIAPVHVLIVPKQHISNVQVLGEQAASNPLLNHIFSVVAQVAKQLGVEDRYNLITNCGAEAGQTIMHLHFHLISGKQFF